MDKDGNCRMCPEKCAWTIHKSTPYYFKYITETVTKTYSDMKEKYEEAIGKTNTYGKYIKDIIYCVDDVFEEIISLMLEMNCCKLTLKNIALRPDPLWAVEHIDFMIESEQEEKQPGYLNRVKILKELRRMTNVDKDVEKLNQDIQDAKERVQLATGKTYRP